jgi:NitT/TauT family transport system permease protein
MISMSAGWVFVVAAEAISVANQSITLPGIGSYINLAIISMNKSAIVYSIVVMFIVIALYDQLIFRPLIAWLDRFQPTMHEDQQEQSSWLLDLFQRAAFFSFLGLFFSQLSDRWINAKIFNASFSLMRLSRPSRMRWWLKLSWYGMLTCLFLIALIFLVNYLHQTITFSDLKHVLFLGMLTTTRVMVLIILSTIIWVPVGVWIGTHSRVSKITQPLIQFFAAFPANLLFPLVFMLIVYYHLNINIWVSPLMILGAQWYILFNVIAGASVLPRELHDMISILQVKGWLKWRRYILPAIFPYLITGSITAAGGAWNISIVAEAIQWGKKTLYANGLGAYITYVTNKGIFPHLVLGIVTMTLFVLAINILIWKPLYRLAQEKYQIL